MSFTIPNKLLKNVEDRTRFLEHLIKEYPSFLQQWSDQLDEKIRKEAEENSDNDLDVYHTIYSQFFSVFEDADYRLDIFYKAMVMAVYSYYDSFINLLHNKIICDKIDCICKVYNIVLSDAAKNAKEEIKSNIRILRNELVHNNEGELKKKQMSKEL